MQRIINDIKSANFKPAYLLFGEEAYLIKQYRDKLKNAVLNGGDGMNVNKFEGKGVSVPQIIDMAETLPFFAEKRIILLENTELFKTGGEQLAEYMANPSDSTCFICVESNVDKRSKLYKALTKIGEAVEFNRLDDATLKRWVLTILKKEQKQITGQTLELFLEKAGNDMENIQKELEKLICYCLDRDVITSEDVEEICIHQIQSQIFEMINAIAAGNQRQALQYYYDLLALREPPMRILVLISRQFNMLLQVKELMRKNSNEKIIGEKVGLAPFIAKKYMSQARAFDIEYLKQALSDCVEAEHGIKSGKMTDQMSVELLIVQYSKKYRKTVEQ